MRNAETRRIDVTLVEGMHFGAIGPSGIAVAVDGPAEFGGVGAGPSPMEMLLMALGSCTGMDVISILRKKRQDISRYRVEVTGTVSDQFPHVYTAIAIRHVVEGNAVSAEAVRRAIELSETKYCGAYAMLKQAAPISSSFEVVAPRPAD